MTAPGGGGADEIRGQLAAALRERQYADVGDQDREQDYRPGAPCMDCGDYPGPRHERSDCPRAVARALLPTVQALITKGAAAQLRTAADWIWDEAPALAIASAELHARADALGGTP